MEKIYIIGVGMTPFRRQPEKSVKQLTAEAVSDAIEDARLSLDDIDSVFFGNCAQGFIEGQHLVAGEMALLPMGFQGKPLFNVENACATASSCLHLAASYLRGGGAGIALAVGVDKMYTEDPDRRFGVFHGAWDVECADKTHEHFRHLGSGIGCEGGSPARVYSPFMDVYAGFARQYMERFGITQRQLAVIASKNRSHARHNERAQFREPLDVDAVINAAPIVYPLTLPMCSPISDGAAAAVLCTERTLANLSTARDRAVSVEASVVRTASRRDADDLHQHLTMLAAQQAYQAAGLQPRDIDVAEVHDATAMGELMQTENLGFCDIGGGGRLAEAGETTIGGRIPVNPSGGLESKGHPIGATGLGQIFELVSQLRGECGERQVPGARFAIQENGGGIWGVEESVCHIGIYARV